MKFQFCSTKSSEALMYSVVTIVNDTVLYT